MKSIPEIIDLAQSYAYAEKHDLDSKDERFYEMRESLYDLQSRLEELNKKVEELEKDAARYRWLLKEKTDSHYYPLSGRIVAVIEFETESSDISEAIDTAMQANKGK